MTARGRSALGVAALAAAGATAVVAPTAGAQQRRGQRVFQWSPAATEVGFQVDAERTDYTGGGARTGQSSHREWIRIPFSGALFRPGVLSYTLALRPQFGQQMVSGLPRAYAVRNSGYDVGVNLFEALPVGLLLNSSRTASSMVGGAGTDGHFGTDTHGGVLRVQVRPFPMTLRFGSRYTNDIWQGSPTLPETRRHERLGSLEFSGVSSKTLLNLTRYVFQDHIGTLSFASADGELSHIHRWGRGSSLQTTFTGGERSGSTPYHRLTWTERVQVRHSEKASSHLDVMRRNSTSGGVGSSGWAAGGGTRYQMRRWLGADLSATRQSSRFERGAMNVSSLLPRVSYTAALPFGARLSGGASVGLERERRSFGGEAWMQVIDERYQAEAGARGTLLQFTDIDAASLTVRSADGTFAFVRDIDYTVLAQGRETRILLLPGGRITAGDYVLISYRRRLALGVDQRSTSASADAALALDGFSVRYAESGRRVRAVGGAVADASGGHDRSAVATLRRNVWHGALEMEVEHNDRRQAAVGYSMDQARIALQPAGNPVLQTAFGATASRSRSAGRTSTAVSTRGTANVNLSPGLRLQGNGEMWLWRYVDARPDRIFAGTLEVDWRFGRVDTEWRYTYQQRTTLQTGRQHRFMLRALRRF